MTASGLCTRQWNLDGFPVLATRAPAKSSGASAKSFQQQQLQNILRNPPWGFL